MKRLLMLSFLLTTATSYAAEQHKECAADDTVTAQASAVLKVAEKMEADGCPKKPAASDFKLICADIATRAKAPETEISFYEYSYEKRIWDLSCATPSKDSEDVAKLKIGKMWNKYKKDFKCDSLDFGLSNGNVLKYSLSQKMPEVIETLADTYGLDINFIDPKDNMNILDYVDAEIKKLNQQPNNAASLKVYNEYRTRLIDLGAKSSNP